MLRFGIMLNQMQLYPWQIKALDELLKTGAICDLVILKEPEPTVPKPGFKKLMAPHLFFEQFKKSALHSNTYKLHTYSPLEGIEQITVKTIKKGKSIEGLSNPDIDKIQSKKLDFIIRFGFGILHGNILHAAKWGVWSFHHGNAQEFRGGPAGFWEIFKGKKKQGTMLQRLTEKLDAGQLILKREYAVIAHSYSENVTKLLMESADMPAQAVRMLANNLMNMDNLPYIQTKAPIYHYPTNLQFLLFILKLWINRIKLKWMVLFKQENWVIGFKREKETEYHYIAPQKVGEYYADPFILNDSQENYILAEHYLYSKKKGHIVLINPYTQGVKTLIEKDTHLSYPFVFEENNNLYVLPEESATGKLNIYQWDGKNQTLDMVKTILNLPAVDASILQHQGTYFLFTGLKDALPNEKLFIFYANQLEGPYAPHPLNPVKTSPEGSRMAGGFVVEGNEILRPAQYSVKYYGEKVVLYQIVKLSTTEYEETYHSELKPNDKGYFSSGLHTYHKNANFEVIDLKKMRSSFAAFKAQL